MDVFECDYAVVTFYDDGTGCKIALSDTEGTTSTLERKFLWTKVAEGRYVERNPEK